MYRTIKKLYVEPTSRCNLNCVMCFRHTWVDETFCDLPTELYFKAINDKEALRDTHTVFFGGMGEPLIHPDILKMLSAATERGFRVELLSNATKLTEQMINDLLDAGLKKLWVSIDSFEEENYESIQVGSVFKRLKKTLALFNRIRDERHSDVELGIAFVLMRSNTGQLRNLKRFAEEVRANDVNMSHMLYNTLDGADESLYDRTLRAQALEIEPSYERVPIPSAICPADVELANKMFEPVKLPSSISSSSPVGLPEISATASVGSCGFAPAMLSDLQNQEPVFIKVPRLARFKFTERDFIEVPGLQESADMFNEKRELMWNGEVLLRRADNCRFIEEGNCFIRSDGDVSPCMGLLHSAHTCFQESVRMIWHHAFGNIKDSMLNDIWNNEDYAAFRQRVIDFDFSPCATCGGCELRDENKEDCFGNEEPTCGACVWGQGLIRCP